MNIWQKAGVLGFLWNTSPFLLTGVTYSKLELPHEFEDEKDCFFLVIDDSRYLE